MKVKIKDIKIENRIRKDMGDLNSLAESIKEFGLLQPIVLNSDLKLIAGERRLEAVKIIGWEEIDANVFTTLDDILKAAKAESEENTCRKDFTWSEAVAMAKLIEDVIKEESMKNRLKNLNRNGDISKKEANFVEGEIFAFDEMDKSNKRNQRSLQKISEIVGKGSYRTFEKAKKVIEAAEEEPKKYQHLVEEMDKTGKVNKSFNQIKIAKEKEKRQEEKQENPNAPIITKESCLTWLPKQEKCDLLITDPPYSTDIEDIESFAKSWLHLGLEKVKDTGRAYICIGFYPNEVKAYLDAAKEYKNDNVELKQILIWEYKNCTGPNPTHLYKLNCQAILYFVGKNAPKIETEILNEKNVVHDIASPTNTTGDKYHMWQKPKELAYRLIRHATKQGDLVLDPFNGTGTFLICASEIGRITKGCDISEEMLKYAEERGCKIV